MIKYTVDEKSRTVTATISGCKDDVLNRVGRVNAAVKSDKGVIKAASIQDSFSAVAKCHPSDTFDENVGKQLAKQRLLNKYHEACARACNRIEEEVNYTYETVTHKLSKDTQRNIEMIRKHAN